MNPAIDSSVGEAIIPSVQEENEATNMPSSSPLLENFAEADKKISLKAVWCCEQVPFHDERALAVWVLQQLNLKSSSAEFFPVELIKEFVHDKVSEDMRSLRGCISSCCGMVGLWVVHYKALVLLCCILRSQLHTMYYIPLMLAMSFL